MCCPPPCRSASPTTVSVAAPTVSFQLTITGFTSDTFGPEQQAAYTKQIENAIKGDMRLRLGIFVKALWLACKRAQSACT